MSPLFSARRWINSATIALAGAMLSSRLTQDEPPDNLADDAAGIGFSPVVDLHRCRARRGQALGPIPLVEPAAVFPV
jgi:hypothetical protein